MGPRSGQWFTRQNLQEPPGKHLFLPDKRGEVPEESILSPPSLCLPPHTHSLPSHLEMWPSEDVEPGAVAAIFSP